MKIMTSATKNAAKRFSVAEHLVNNRDCGTIYDLSRFKIVHHSNNVFNPNKMEAIINIL